MIHRRGVIFSFFLFLSFRPLVDPFIQTNSLLIVREETFPFEFLPHYSFKEKPAHLVRVKGFWIDPYEVTNEDFTLFVDATNHRTFAEIAPDPETYPGN